MGASGPCTSCVGNKETSGILNEERKQGETSAIKTHAIGCGISARREHNDRGIWRLPLSIWAISRPRQTEYPAVGGSTMDRRLPGPLTVVGDISQRRVYVLLGKYADGRAPLLQRRKGILHPISRGAGSMTSGGKQRRLPIADPSNSICIYVAPNGRGVGAKTQKSQNIVNLDVNDSEMSGMFPAAYGGERSGKRAHSVAEFREMHREAPRKSDLCSLRGPCGTMGRIGAKSHERSNSRNPTIRQGCAPHVWGVRDGRNGPHSIGRGDF